MLSKFLIGAALATAQATPPPPCVTTQEFGDLIAAVIPFVVEGAVAQCRQHLPADAFLRGDTDALVERWRQQTSARMAPAAATFARISGLRMGNSEAADMRVFGRMMAAYATNGLDATKCRQVDLLVRSMAPLHADNIAGMMGALVGLTQGGRRMGANGLSICPA